MDRHPRPALSHVVTLAAAACVLAVATLLTACSAQATTDAAPLADASSGSSASASSTSGPSVPRSASGGVSDWQHVLQVLASLDAAPPSEPVICLLGGSAARESTVSDRKWAEQVQQKGGPAVMAYNLGSRNRTLAQDLRLVRWLPQGTIVLIGVNVGRFTPEPSSPKIALPKPAATLSPYTQHLYDKRAILSPAKKRELLRKWLTERYPLFKKNYAYNKGVLEKLVVLCKRRGLHPVLFELPRNTSIIDHALDAPVTRYTRTAKALARAQAIPWFSLVSPAHVPNSSFYDLWHLVPPGRRTWQNLLSAQTVIWLREYGLDGTGG